MALLALGFYSAQPAHVEAVAWVAHQKDLLSAIFIVSSLLALSSWLAAEGRGWRLPALSWIFLAFGLLSKSLALATPIAATLIILLFRSDFKDRARSFAAAVLPMVALAAVSLLAGIRLYETSYITMADELPILSRLARSLLILGYQARIALAPVNLRLVYDIFDPVHFRLTLILGGLTLGGAALATLALWRQRSVAAFGVAWFPVFLLGFLHLKTLKTWSFVAERYLFLPLFGSSLVVAALAVPLLHRSSSARRRALAAALVVALLVTGFALSARRSAQWESAESLLAANSRLQPGHHYSRFLEIEYLLKKRGDFPAARQTAERVSDPEARNALLLYVEALRVNSTITSLSQVDRAVRATRDLHAASRDMAHETDPANVPKRVLAWTLLGQVRKLYERLGRLAPHNMEIAYNWALLEMTDHEYSSAEALFRKALDSGAMPRSALLAAWNNLGLALRAQGKLDEAEPAFHAALRADRLEWRAALNLLRLPKLTQPGITREMLSRQMEERAKRAGLDETEINRLLKKAGGP